MDKRLEMQVDEIKKQVFEVAKRYEVNVMMFSSGKFAIDINQENVGKFLEEIKGLKIH